MIRKKFPALLTALAFISIFQIAPQKALAQTTPSSEIVLVLPFENTSDHPEYNWIGESFSDSLSAVAFSAASSVA